METRYYLIKGRQSGKEYYLHLEGDNLVIEAALRGIDSGIYEINRVDCKTFCKNLEKKALEKEKKKNEVCGR